MFLAQWSSTTTRKIAAARTRSPRRSPGYGSHGLTLRPTATVGDLLFPLPADKRDRREADGTISESYLLDLNIVLDIEYRTSIISFDLRKHAVRSGRGVKQDVDLLVQQPILPCGIPRDKQILRSRWGNQTRLMEDLRNPANLEPGKACVTLPLANKRYLEGCGVSRDLHNARIS
jgi:hypothetical protein